MGKVDSYEEEKKRRVTYMQLYEEHKRIAQYLRNVYAGKSQLQRAAAIGKMLGETSVEALGGMVKGLEELTQNVLPAENIEVPLTEESFYAAESLILADHWKQHPEAIRELNEEKIVHMMEALGDAVHLADVDADFRSHLRSFMQGKEPCPVEFDDKGDLHYRVPVREIPEFQRRKEPQAPVSAQKPPVRKQEERTPVVRQPQKKAEVPVLKPRSRGM